MKKVLLLYMAYPFAIASYFRHALEKRRDIELYTAGAFTGQSIPWGGGMTIPNKYLNTVDLALPSSITKPAWMWIERKFDVKFDLVINVDAGFHLSTKPDVPYAVVATDPHVLAGWYADVRPKADWFFNMQRYYMEPGDIHLPYCASPDHHYPMSDVEKDHDAALFGLHYPQRDLLVSILRGRGFRVLYDLGLIYDEYREQNNRATVGLNWSSLMDINARFFEAMAMKQVLLTNRLPHIEELGFEEGRHYLGFGNELEAVAQMEWVRANPEAAQAIALNGYQHVMANHTYEMRVNQILQTTGLI